MLLIKHPAIFIVCIYRYFSSVWGFESPDCLLFQRCLVSEQNVILIQSFFSDTQHALPDSKVKGNTSAPPLEKYYHPDGTGQGTRDSSATQKLVHPSSCGFPLKCRVLKCHVATLNNLFSVLDFGNSIWQKRFIHVGLQVQILNRYANLNFPWQLGKLCDMMESSRTADDFKWMYLDSWDLQCQWISQLQCSHTAGG